MNKMLEPAKGTGYLFDGALRIGKYQTVYVRLHRRKDGYIVYLWEGNRPEGKPISGPWLMPETLGLDAAIASAINHTPGIGGMENATTTQD